MKTKNKPVREDDYINNLRRRQRGVLFRYLAVSIFCLVFFVVYSHFSHGIQSFWMTFLFVWPLILGGIPALLILCGILSDTEEEAVHNKTIESAGQKKKEEEQGYIDTLKQLWKTGGMQKDLYRFGIASVTAASFLKGALEIAGTDSLYPNLLLFVGILLLVTGAVFYLLNIRWQAGHAAL